ncbi:MAG: polysulfide reductase NrfD [Planctomycetes bacterium]|nr:polysulfide reductase NrfD [Planctomycetota bacterium]
MRYGFVLDQNRCIGCHACTVACKEENNVPLGTFRTWVKYVEKGHFPDTSRHFAVLRCNHCDNAPCIEICPTSALFRRNNGIVDFDRDACIGCKACMQACPYDALYIDPATDTAAKCNFCAHRVEVGLEPACVIVCPEQAIITGDLDDPASRIAKLVAKKEVQVRKPEQGTQPKVFYLGADAATLTPSMTQAESQQMWSTPTASEAEFARSQARDHNPVDAMARTVYDTPKNRAPWGWKVAAYLWTKSIAAGVMMIVAGEAILNPDGLSFVSTLVAPAIALAFTAITALLLIADLKRPERFYLILLRPNWRSWLVWGTIVLMVFGALTLAWLAAGAFGQPDWIRMLAWPTFIASVGAAGYSAFLFGQANGRAFWRSPLLLGQLVVAAGIAGTASLMAFALIVDSGESVAMTRCIYVSMERVIGQSVRGMLVLFLMAGLVVLAGEFLVPHGSTDSHRAACMLTRGRWRIPFWLGVVLAGHLGPIFLIATFRQDTIVEAAASLLALAGLYIYEHLWIKAGQAPPLS